MKKNKKGRKRDYSAKRYELLSVVSDMPCLRHSFEGKEFDVRKSEVMNWLLQQDAVLKFLWEELTLINHCLDLMWYNPKTKKWQGIKFTEKNLNQFLNDNEEEGKNGNERN